MSKTYSILASGDDHYNEHSRFDECVEMHDFMVDVAVHEKVDAFISPGDMFERPISTPNERREVADFVRHMADVCAFLHAHGNHGNQRDMQLMTKLKTRHPVIVETMAAVHRVGDLATALMAWPERAQLLAQFQQSSAELDLTAQEQLRNVIRGLGAQMANHAGPRVLAGHFMVDGSVTSVGQPLIGQSMNVGLADLALADVPLVLMSHIHAPQAWTYGETEIVYCGSSHRTTYGEVEEKSLVLARFEGARLLRVERIPTPCAQMFLIEDEWGVDVENGNQGWLAGMHGHPGWDAIKGAEVRFRYYVSVDMREAARAAAAVVEQRLREHGAKDVKVDPVAKTTGTARAPEVAQVVTMEEKLRALWKARGTTPEELRAHRLITKAKDVEARRAV